MGHPTLPRSTSTARQRPRKATLRLGIQREGNSRNQEIGIQGSQAMSLQHPPVDTLWKIVQSHPVHIPETLATDSLAELRLKIQQLANGKWEGNPRHKPYGNIQFRYETDAENMVTRVHCYFNGRNSRKLRFMKLERIV